MEPLARPTPPQRAQSLADSCWAAVLTAWSFQESRIRGEGGTQLYEMPLVQEFGEGPTGGLNPQTKFPELCKRYGLGGNGFWGDDLWSYVKNNLAASYIFCAYKRTSYHHAVLIYKLDYDTTEFHFMDPDGGKLRHEKQSYFLDRSPLLLARYGG